VDFKLLARHRLYTTDDFWFEVDTYIAGAQPLLIAHVRIARWAPSVVKECHRVWDAFLKCVPGPIYTYGIDGSEKFSRFVRAFGYEPFLAADGSPLEITCLNGERRRLFVHKGLQATNDGRRKA
jgi:hypothetical protein